MTYNEAYDKIIQAYFKDEIEPLKAKFCFCGTLCNRDSSWYRIARQINEVHYDFMDYNGKEYVLMEQALFASMRSTLNGTIADARSHPKYEEALFNGMCVALEVLKQIHIERGEIIDEDLRLTKREKNMQLS